MIKADKIPVLLHLPKTGGTTIRNVMGLPVWFKRHRVIGSTRLHKLVRRLGDRGHVFAFLRDPMDRAVSAYYFFSRSREGTDRPPKGFNSVKQKAWLFSVVAECAEMDANQFYKGLLKNNALQYRRMCRVEPHFIPQAQWIRSAEKMGAPIHAYDFANFSAEFDRLLDDIGAKERPRLRHMMKTRRPPWMDELTPETVAMLKQFYAADYELLKAYGIDCASADM